VQSRADICSILTLLVRAFMLPWLTVQTQDTALEHAYVYGDAMAFVETERHGQVMVIRMNRPERSTRSAGAPYRPG